jgi:hypothetical protein
MLLDQAAIDQAVNQSFPHGLEPGHTFGVVGVVNPQGVEAVATVQAGLTGLQVQGYYLHPWKAHDWLGDENQYGGRILFSR